MDTKKLKANKKKKHIGMFRRWAITTLIPIVVFLLMLDIVLYAVINASAYDNVAAQLEVRADFTVEFFGRYMPKQPQQFFISSKRFIEEFPEANLMTVQIIKPDGKELYSSSGFPSDYTRHTLDFKEALEHGSGSYTGYDSDTEEQIMAVSRLITDSNNAPLAVLRFVSSVNGAARFINLFMLLVFLITAMIIIFVLFIGIFFLRSIIARIRILKENTEIIASGDMDIRITAKHNDELGDLTSTLIHMAGELSKTEKLKNEFLSSISHELRTPLTAIQGWSDTIKDTDMDDTETIRKGIVTISKESERLTKMVEELLDFSRIEAGHFKLNLDMVEIVSEFEETVFMYMEKAKSLGVRIEYKLPEEIPKINGDKSRLKQVFVNILDNALKHTPEGGVIRTGISEADGEISIMVKDNGSGISKEDLPRIKERFYKGKSTKRGSGIGLAICDEIINMHGGRLEIDSVETEGTSVTIILPL